MYVTGVMTSMNMRKGYCTWVCVSHLTSGVSVRPENTVTYSVDNGGPKFCGFFSEKLCYKDPALPLLKDIRIVSHFPAESMHVHYNNYKDLSRVS